MLLRLPLALGACLLALLVLGAPAGAQAPGPDSDGGRTHGGHRDRPQQPVDREPADPWDEPDALPTDPWDQADQLPADPWDQADERPTDPWDNPPQEYVLPEPAVFPTTTQKTVVGRTAMLRTDGLAAIPRGAPKRVRTMIAAANGIIGKPYKWGGGHGRLIDSGYDCSGAVSYALIRSGLQRGSMVSGQLARAYAPGAGRYVSIYGNRTHVYMEIAGLRLDTSPYGTKGYAMLGRSGVRWRPVVGRRTGFAARHPVRL